MSKPARKAASDRRASASFRRCAVSSATRTASAASASRAARRSSCAARAATLSAAPRACAKLLLQGGPFVVVPVTVGDPGGGSQRDLLLGRDPPLVLRPACASRSRAACSPVPRSPRLGVPQLQLLGLLGELPVRAVTRLGGRGRQRLAYEAEPALVLGGLFVGALVRGEGALLGLPVDVSGVLARGCGVRGSCRTRRRARRRRDRRRVRGDALETSDRAVGPGRPSRVHGRRAPGRGRVRAPGELVALPGGPEPRLGGIAPLGELFRACGGLLRGLDARLELRAGRLPGGEPALGVLADVLVLALLTVQGGALRVSSPSRSSALPGRLQSAELLGRLARRRREPGRTGSA